ncbi:YadA-like family protein, partial [Haemophilus haemolyticus]|uniref:YadA-like family protein n=1 Tax=Haemophilus haemolyticus TaxID=726 RepID=UPI00062D6655
GTGGTTVKVEGTSGKRTVTVSSTLDAGEKGEITAVTKENKVGAEKVGQVKPKTDADKTKVTTVKNVADMINAATWYAKADNSDDDVTATTGDDGEAVNAGSKLTFKAGKNLHVNRANGVFTFALDSALKDLTSTTYKNGDNKVTVSADTNGDLHISKLKPGSTNETVDAKITGVAEGTKDNDAVNVKQLKETELHIAPTKSNGKDSGVTYTYDDKTKSVTLKYKDGNGNDIENTEAKIDLSGLASKIKDYSFKTNATGSNLVGTGTDTTVASGKSVNFAASDNLTLKQDVEGGNVTYTYGLKNQVVVGEKGTPGADGKPGKDGVDGSIGVNGKDGSAVAINGKDGSIGLNGKDGKNGLTIKGDKGAVGVDGTNGKDGKDGMTRIVYTDNNNVKHEVATLDDGVKYAGDDAQPGDGQTEHQKDKVIAKKLNNIIDIIGGADKDKLSDKNIGVNNVDGKLKVQLAKELKGLTSAEFKDGDDKTKTEITHNGITITPVNPANGKTAVTLTDAGLNNGGNKITHVAEGTDDTDAVNVKQLKDFKSEVADGGLTFAGNSGTAHKAKLNSTVNIKGGEGNTDADQFDNGKNVMTTVNGDTVTVSIKKTPEVEGINITDTTGNVKVKLTQTERGLQVSGADGKETNITNVKAGEKDTDAVNVKQLKAAKTEVEAGDHIDVTSRVGANGQTIYKVSAKGINDTSAAVKAGSNHVEVTKAANTHKDGSTTVTDYTVDLSDKTKEDIKKGVDAHTEVTTKGLTFNADKGSTGVKKLGSKVAVNGDGKNITTTADENGVKVSMKDDINVNSVTANKVKVGDVNINENGINAGGKRITNVAPGKDGTDAVNVNQLKYVAGNISNQINNVDKGLRAGIAGALASGGLYHVTTAGKSMVSVGAGTYRGQNALAVGYSRLSDNGKVGVKFTVNSNSQGHAGASASVGYQW